MRPEKQTASGCLGNSFTHGQTPPSPCPPNHTKHTPWLWVIHRVERQAWMPYFFQSRRDIGDHPEKCLKDPTEETMVEKWEAGGGGLRWRGRGVDYGCSFLVPSVDGSSIYPEMLSLNALPIFSVPECKR